MTDGLYEITDIGEGGSDQDERQAYLGFRAWVKDLGGKTYIDTYRTNRGISRFLHVKEIDQHVTTVYQRAREIFGPELCRLYQSTPNDQMYRPNPKRRWAISINLSDTGGRFVAVKLEG